jgi:C4-dicarboxylate-specific signal transduction histidine kinase
MDPYALNHAISEVREELKRCEINPNTLSREDEINWAFKLLLIDELKQLNRNLERISHTTSFR